MKKTAILLIVMIIIPFLARASDKIEKDCTYKGRKLYGRVQVVNAFPDLRVQVVNAFPDLRVLKVNGFPSECGRWEIVKAFPDIRIQYVNAFPDITIQLVNAFPGLP